MLHDHHAVIYNPKQDYHLYCNDTMNNTKSFKYNINYIQQRSLYENVFRRCVMVTTPSENNKRIYEMAYPDIMIKSAPNRKMRSEKRVNFESMHLNRSNDPLWVVVLGALSIGKGRYEDFYIISIDFHEIYFFLYTLQVELFKISPV